MQKKNLKGIANDSRRKAAFKESEEKNQQIVQRNHPLAQKIVEKCWESKRI